MENINDKERLYTALAKLQKKVPTFVEQIYPAFEANNWTYYDVEGVPSPTRVESTAFDLIQTMDGIIRRSKMPMERVHASSGRIRVEYYDGEFMLLLDPTCNARVEPETAVDERGYKTD